MYSNARTAAGVQAGDITFKGIQDMIRETYNKSYSKKFQLGEYDMLYPAYSKEFKQDKWR